MSCGLVGRANRAGSGGLPPDVERLVEALVSPRTGVIEHLARLHHGAAAPPNLVMYQALLSHFDFRKSELRERAGIGKGETAAEAIRGAIGEAIEQYCACQLPPDAIIEAPYADLAGHALDPAACVLYAESQYAQPDFPYHRFDPAVPLGWVRGQRLTGDARDAEPPGSATAGGGTAGRRSPPTERAGGDGGRADQDVLIPAALVYMTYAGDRPEQEIVEVTSNGLAAGPSLEFALLRGLWELVERDAFMLTWLNRLPLPRVDIASLDGLPRTIRAHFARFGIEVHVFNATTDLPIAVMIAVAVDRSGRGPAAVVGLGCDLTPAAAVRRALLEVCQLHPGETMRYRERQPEAGPRAFEDVRDMTDHSALFTLPAMLPQLGCLLDTPRTQRIEELPDLATGDLAADLARCAGWLAGIGSRAAYVDLTTPDIAPLGLHVVRVVATELQPIHFGHGRARLGGRRLYTIARTLGYAATLRTEAELNPCPHPLA